MIVETLELGLGELDVDDKLNLLFSGVMGVAPMMVEENKQQPKGDEKMKKYTDWSDLDIRDEVYSQRPLDKRKRIKKVQHKAWKNLKKTRNDTYIRMLESKVQNLQKQISKQKAINKSNQDYIKKLSLSEQIVDGVFVGRSQIYDRLEALTEQTETQEVRKQMIKEISTLRYRLGVQGKDRIKALNHYFKQMVESFIPQCQRFLIYAACKQIDFFAQDYIDKGIFKYSKQQTWREEIMKSMHLSYEQRKTISNFKPLIMGEKHKYDQLVHQFFDVKKQLTEQAKKLENVFDGFRAFLTPYQLSKILVNVEKNKYRKQMNLESVDSFWAYEFDVEEKMSIHSLFATTATESWN